jgi:hypothetical protein
MSLPANMTMKPGITQNSCAAARLLVFSLLILPGIPLLGCGDFRAATPPGFVELPESDHYDYRATTADGLVLAVRSLVHDPKGELGFWATAIEKQMREHNGYALLEARDVKNAEGLAGKQLRFGYDEAKQPHLYYVTIFATDARLYLLEAGGKKQLMEEHAGQIGWSVEHFQAD